MGRVDVSGDDMVKAVGVGSTIIGGFATVITWIVTKASKGEVKQLSTEDLENLRRVVDNLVSSHTRGQIDSAEIKKDIQHILEKLEHFEEQREKDHVAIKTLNQILYPLLKEEIAAQRKQMGLDGGLAQA